MEKMQSSPESSHYLFHLTRQKDSMLTFEINDFDRAEIKVVS